jgi:AcrR family transcriptional regulator
VTVQQRGLDTRRRVLDAALPLFAAAGRDVHIDDLRAASGVSVGSIYHHFGSRDGVVTALYGQCLGELTSTLAAAVLATDDPRSGIESFVRTYLHWMDTHPAAARLIFSVTEFRLDAGGLEASSPGKQAALAELGAWYARHAAHGRVRTLPLPVVELLLVGPLAEYCQRRLSGAFPPDLSGSVVRAALTTAAWHALRA